MKLLLYYTCISVSSEVDWVNDELFSGPALPKSPINCELESEMELFGEQEISIPSEEDEQFSDDSKSDEGEEVWEESDESCTEES